LMGTTSDSEATESVLGKLNNIREISDSAKSSANASLSIITEIRDDLGINGQTPNLYDKVSDLETTLSELSNLASQISDNQLDYGTVAEDMLDTLGELVNQASKSLGLEIEIKELVQQDYDNVEKVNDKLQEIDAKLSALKESIAEDDVIIKSWFESE